MPSLCRRRSVAIIAAAVCFVGIAVAAERSAGSQPSSIAGAEASAVDDPMLAAAPAAPRAIASWDEALALVRAHSPEYITGAESIRRAAGQKQIALATILPSINGQGTYTHQFEPPLRANIGGVPLVTPPPNAWTVSGTLAWSIVSPRGIYGVGTADVGVDVARLSFEDERRQIAVAVVDGMLTTLSTERVAELNRVGLRAALARGVLTRTRLQFGQGTELDVDRAQQDVEATRSVLIRGDESLRQARENLAVLVGAATPAAAAPDLVLDEFEAAVARSCRLNDDIERRPDVAAARARVELGERTVRDVELQFAPSLGVNAEALYATPAVLAPNTTVFVEGVLNVPIFEGGARFGALRDSRAALEQARQALVGTRVNAIVGSARASRAVAVLTDTRAVAKAERDLAARVDMRVRDGYAHGLGTSLDLVTSAQALRQADINLAVIEFQLAQARAEAVLVNAECVY